MGQVTPASPETTSLYTRLPGSMLWQRCLAYVRISSGPSGVLNDFCVEYGLPRASRCSRSPRPQRMRSSSVAILANVNRVLLKLSVSHL